MAVPEAAMNEDHLAPARERQVWFSGKIIAMETISKPTRMEHAPNN